MNRMSAILGLFAASGFLGAPVLHAEGRDAAPQCNGSRFSTCASAQVEMVGHDLFLGRSVPAATFGRDHRPGFDGPRPGGFAPHGGLDAPVSCDDGRMRSPGDCPVTVTPEPLSMTLMATGLFGIVAASRRKRPQTLPVG